MASNKFTIRGKTYDLSDAVDLVSIQNALVPENWPGKKPDCVRLFIATQEMLSLQLKRHLANNFKHISKVAQEEAADGQPAKIGVTFAFELDQTSPLVAAITKLSMSYTVRHGTKGKPQTFDLTQGELPLDSDLTSAFDKSLEKEGEKPEKEGKVVAMPPPDGAPAGGDVTPENTPGDTQVDKPRGRRKKSS